MKRKIITCDLCGKDITDAKRRYRFKRYESTYANFDNFEWAKWERCDMCHDCYYGLLGFVDKRRRESADNA